MPFYPEYFLTLLRDRVNLLQLIGSHVTLRKQGSNWAGLCPFHQEKTASFTVRPEKGLFKCFGCGAGGDAIDFLMRMRSLSFQEAVTDLAQQCGLPLPDEGHRDGPASSEEQRQQQLKQQRHDLLAACNEWFQHCLNGPAGERARDYLTRRGLDASQWQRLGLGYAPPGWQTLLDHFGLEQTDQLVAIGVVIQRQAEQPGRQDDHRPFYDRFRNRIMFPIHDPQGRCVAFGGRILGAGEPKYINSPETALYHKGDLLYGLHLAQESIRRVGQVLVVEGYMDRIALAMQGFDYAVATLGTALTERQLALLWQRTSKIIFCFDGDKAGYQAAWRALEQTVEGLSSGRHVRFLFLPEGMDPDDLMRHEGAAGLQARLQQAMPLWDFLYQRLSSDLHLQSPDDRAALVHRLRPYLDRMSDPLLRQFYAEALAQRVGLPSWRITGRSTATRYREPQAAAPASQPLAAGRDYEQFLLALLLRYPTLILEQEEVLSTLHLDNRNFAGLLRSLVEQVDDAADGMDPDQWQLSPEQRATAEQILQAEQTLPEQEQDRRRELAGCLTSCQLRQLQRERSYLQQSGLSTTPQWNDESLRRLLALKQEEHRLHRNKKLIVAPQ
ncbi:MAG: DNA primase [Magnetococcales bacterium]|nr:DNA primase [Magnetococcales bacterium]